MTRGRCCRWRNWHAIYGWARLLKTNWLVTQFDRSQFSWASSPSCNLTHLVLTVPHWKVKLTKSFSLVGHLIVDSGEDASLSPFFYRRNICTRQYSVSLSFTPLPIFYTDSGQPTPLRCLSNDASLLYYQDVSLCGESLYDSFQLVHWPGWSPQNFLRSNPSIIDPNWHSFAICFVLRMSINRHTYSSIRH